MRFSKIMSAQNRMLAAHLISVETDISRGLHSFTIVGLADKAVDEARDRVSAAIKNSGFKSPKQTNAKITVSLAPADIKKEGTGFDLPIAIGYLLASEEIEFDPQNKMFVGELALDGTIRRIDGVLSFARMAERCGYKEIFVPQSNAAEAALVKGLRIYGVDCLFDIALHLDLSGKVAAVDTGRGQRLVPVKPTDPKEYGGDRELTGDLDDVVGQETAKRGLIIAAAGRHNIALYGPPGTGKTMLARALMSILPPLTFDEMLEVTEIHSVAGALEGPLVARAPVRTPHHTASYTSIVGGGSTPRPGEITLAHRGALFMDEFPEFDKRVIESLRQPLEDKVISIARAKGTARFPADFILIAAMNPCPCGNRGINGKQCSCSPSLARNYEKRISGPITDRIDIWIEVSRIEHENLMKGYEGRKETLDARVLIKKARSIQSARFSSLGIDATANSNIHSRDLARSVALSLSAKDALDGAAVAYDLSGRGYHRVVKLARTIADLDDSKNIEAPHILEALQYRQRYFRTG